MNTDRDLIAEYVRLTRMLTQAEAGLRIGVSQKTISEWRAGKYRDLQPGTRAVLMSFLGDETAEKSTSLPGSRRTTSDIARQIDEVNALDEDGRTKARLIAEIASAYRWSAVHHLATALRIAEETLSLRARYLTEDTSEQTKKSRRDTRSPLDEKGGDERPG